MFDKYSCYGQISISDYLSSKIKNKSVMDLTSFINSKGKSQYDQISKVVKEAYENYKQDENIVDRITNQVSIYVLNKSLEYMKYLQKENDV